MIKILFGGAEFPKALYTMPDPPKVLHVEGNIDILNAPCAAIVGTRKMSATAAL